MEKIVSPNLNTQSRHLVVHTGHDESEFMGRSQLCQTHPWAAGPDSDRAVYVHLQHLDERCKHQPQMKRTVI